MSDEPNVLICQRASGPSRIRAAMQRACARCAVVCWVSPASLATIAQHGPEFAIVCVECGVPEAKAAMHEGKMEMQLPSAGQLDEMREHVSDVDAHRLYELAHRFIQRGKAGR